MFKAGALIFILLLCLPGLLAAQDDPGRETDWDDFEFYLYARGDRAFIVNAGLIFPMLFIREGSNDTEGWRTMGGSFSLAYHYYLNPHLYIGGDLGVIFIPTRAANNVFMVPFGLRIGTQFIAGQFEFPIAATLGFAWQRYLDLGYFGPFMKVTGSVLYRATPSWAFGLTPSWYFMPQWTNNRAENVFGNFLELALTARHQF